MAYKRSRKDFEADLQRQESPFVFYGTPLPPLDEHTRDDGSFVPVWKQEVTDDRGRKRLHGAFTGGFSAGYFNTVGSKEGWTPSTFVSSRTNRANGARNAANQKPEDFMDEEDIREQEESRHLTTDQNFTGFGTADDVSRQGTLMDLFRPMEQTMGAKLLNRMGWKQGQGIGPKIRRRADPEDETSAVHLFAPDDAPMISLTKKIDQKGLGYDDQTKTTALLEPRVRHSRPQSASQSEGEEEAERPGLSFASRSKKVASNKGGAFGVGILNDTGSDEEDPYTIGPAVSYQKTLGGVKGRKKKEKKPVKTKANPLVKNKPVFISTRLNSISNALRKCHDGRLPLDGFVLADGLAMLSTLSVNDDAYKPPKVPEGWKSSKAASPSSPSELATYESTAEAARTSVLNNSSRGALLGETALPGKSVFDFLTPAAREKLIKVIGKANLPPALGESLPGSSHQRHQNTDLQVPPIAPHTALQALSRILNGGFTPYTQDFAKSLRYKTYLESQANTGTDDVQAPPTSPGVRLNRPPSMTQDEFLLELHEFARTAEVFKPVSGPMASRFTTSTSSTTIPPSDPGVQDLLTRPAPSKAQDPAEQAAKLNMFGPLTRSVANFYPTRLLCKRFGVAMPTHMDDDGGAGDSGRGPQSTSTPSSKVHPTNLHGEGSGGSTIGTSRFQSAGFQHDEKTDVRRATDPSAQHAPLENNNDDVGVHAKDQSLGGLGRPTEQSTSVVIDPERNEALESERPGAAVFRAIFGSDDEDDD